MHRHYGLLAIAGLLTLTCIQAPGFCEATSAQPAYTAQSYVLQTKDSPTASYAKVSPVQMFAYQPPTTVAVEGIGGIAEGAAITPVMNQSAEAAVVRFISTYNKNIPSYQAYAIAKGIVYFSQMYQVDYRLITSVIAVESSFRDNAISKSGAIGLGQLKPATAKWLGVVNPFDPIDNIAGATRYLSFLQNRYNGDLDKTLSAYYQGQGTVDRKGITPACHPYLMKVNNVLRLF